MDSVRQAIPQARHLVDVTKIVEVSPNGDDPAAERNQPESVA
jgi:hypothetical protein